MEGILTCLVGIVGYFFLVDFPDRASKTTRNFLTEAECQFIMRRVAKDRDDAAVESFNFKKWAASGLDLKIWGFAMIYLCLTTIAYAIAYFLPIILREGMGYSIGASQCLVAPPYAFAAILMYGGAWFGDKFHLRGPVLVFNAVVCLVGLPILVSLVNTLMASLTSFRAITRATASDTSASSSSPPALTPISPPPWPTKQTIFEDNGSEPSAVPLLSASVALAVSLDLSSSEPKTPLSIDLGCGLAWLAMVSSSSSFLSLPCTSRSATRRHGKARW